MIKKRIRRTSRLADARVALAVAAAAIDPYRPLIANLIITRRCNLSCSYCAEYDKVSAPVPLAILKERIDHIARLRAVFLTLTGGESLLHPEVAAIVRHARMRGLVPLLNTNGYLLTRDKIDALNAAGLYGLQLSIDNLTPSAATRKSLEPLMPKLLLLAEHARFRVRINTVLGSSPAVEAVVVARVAMSLGFDVSTSLLRDGLGALIPLGVEQREAYHTIRGLGRRAPAYISDDFTSKLVDDGELDWKCRAGARTFHVDELGKVHLCAPRTGYPDTPIGEYGEADIRREFHTRKACAIRCPIAYAHHASQLDRFRPQALPPARRPSAYR